MFASLLVALFVNNSLTDCSFFLASQLTFMNLDMYRIVGFFSNQKFSHKSKILAVLIFEVGIRILKYSCTVISTRRYYVTQVSPLNNIVIISVQE